MSSRITINVGFYFQQQHYAQMQAYIPRREALEIPGLRVRENEARQEAEQQRGSRHPRSQSKKDSDEEMFDEAEGEAEAEEMEAENEDENQGEQEHQNDQVERALEELEEDDFDSDGSSDSESDLELSSIDGPAAGKAYRRVNKTKRQKGDNRDLIQLPDRRPRRDKKVDEATEMIRREEKERKRKQYLKKQVEAHEKATLEKILNETGRKLRLREQKEMQEELERDQKSFRSLGDVPKVVQVSREKGEVVMTHNTPLFPAWMTTPPDLKMKDVCSKCGAAGKYKLRNNAGFACSLPCYKLVCGQ